MSTAPIHEPTKCSGFVDGKCTHGHSTAGNYVCRGHRLLNEPGLVKEEPGAYKLNRRLLMPACVIED